MSGILKVYELAEAAMPERDCTGRACCCHFPTTGREPFVTELELGAILDELAVQGRRIPPPRADGACPLLVDERCSVYAARPLGCRTYFCREAGGPATARQMRDAVQLLNSLDERQPRGRRGSRTLIRALDDARKGKSGRPVR